MSAKLTQFGEAYCLDVEDGCVHISDEEVCFAFTQEEARALCAALVECGFGPEVGVCDLPAALRRAKLLEELAALEIRIRDNMRMEDIQREAEILAALKEG